MADTGCGKNKILKCLKELEEDVHLIERKKQEQLCLIITGPR